MNADSLLGFAAAVFSLALALACILRKRPSFAAWCFFTGMLAMGCDRAFSAMSSIGNIGAEKVASWQSLSLLAKSFVPGIWLSFSFTFSRGNYREFLARWRFPLLAAGLVPIGLSFGFRGELLHVVRAVTPVPHWWLEFGGAGRILNILLLIASSLVLMNLEQTFRSAVGTMRWRIKFVVLGFAVIFGAAIYTRSQSILFSRQNLALTGIESGALVIGCAFLALAYVRTGLAEIDVYPSEEVLRKSLTVLCVGGYLFLVGVLAQIVKRLGGGESFPAQAFLVLLGMSGLVVLLLSDRFRQGIHRFVVRHFKRARHDSLRVWTLFSQQMASVKDEGGMCGVAARLISETFAVLSVTVWLIEKGRDELVFGASTVQKEGHASSPDSVVGAMVIEAGLRGRLAPFDLEEASGDWASTLKQLSLPEFQNGGNRVCLPLCAGDKVLGAVILADRVNGASYSVDELDLLKCIGDQITASLLNLRLTNELVLGKEMEAFRTMSAFFVHDLKNTASSLTLMLKNLPVHFDNPEFREDALRGIANTAGRIDSMISRLSVLREKLVLHPVASDLNQLVTESLDRLDGIPQVTVTRELRPLPKILVDREQIQSVVTNLVLNAKDAMGAGGRIHVQTDQRDGRAIFSITDNGCGMSPAFVKESLFRPFHSTKKKGLGIGMFQSRMVVEAHRGSIQVESEAGKGTTFRVMLPIGLQV